MATPTAAISGAVTIAILSWLFRLARKPVPVLPDGSLLVRYGKWMVAVGVACGVLMPLALVVFAVMAGFRNSQDPYYFGGMRSEEHTSELQSQFHLVCRLLLEKK